VAALGVLPKRERKDWAALARRLLNHESERVRVAAMRALAEIGDTAELADRLYDISPGVRGHAAFLIADGDLSRPPLDHPAVREVLALEGVAGVRAKRDLLQSVHAHGGSRWVEMVLQLAQEGEESVAPDLVLAMGRLHDERFIPFLIQRLPVREARSVARAALVALGASALDELERLLRDPGADVRVRRHIPRTISRFATQRAADILTEQIEREENGLVRYKILRGLGRLVTEAPVVVDRLVMERQLKQNLVEHLRMLALERLVTQNLGEAEEAARASGELLAGLLGDKTKQALERAFRFLHVVHRNEDILAVARAADSADRRVRAQALEFLDNLMLDAPLPENRQLFALTIDDLDPAERVARAGPLLGDLPRDYHDALRRMIHDEDEVLSAVAAYHAVRLRLGDLRDSVVALAQRRSRLNFLREQLERVAQLAQEPKFAG
jgi:HEAT repeat protein